MLAHQPSFNKTNSEILGFLDFLPFSLPELTTSPTICCCFVVRRTRIKIKQYMSDCFQLNSGVPQGSCLGPVLFLMYATEPFKVVDKHLTNNQTYADDRQ